MLKVSGLSFDYQDKPLLDQVSFQVLPGQVLHLRGKNGAGKTTLLQLLAGLIEPHQGQIDFQNQPIHSQLSNYQKQLVYIGHKPGFNASLTVRENYQANLLEPSKRAAFEDYLAHLGLIDLGDTLCAQLSLGQRRRVSLLRLGLSDAKLWLLDEPMSALDQASVSLLMGCIARHIENQGAVIMTSHQGFPAPSFSIHEVCLP